VAAATIQGYVEFHAISHHEETNTVIVVCGRKRKDRCDLGRDNHVPLKSRPEVFRCREVHNEKHTEFTLFHVLFDKKTTTPGSNIPVDRTHVVPRLVFSNIRELHPTSLEN
jgi:hypothetical protein